VNQQAIESISYNVQVVKYEVVDNDYAVYMIKIVGPNNISFHISDRYSSIRSFQQHVKRNIASRDGIPEFPAKKYFDNLNANWLEQRKRQLGLFMNTFLAHPLVKSSPLLPVYFKEKMTGEGSAEAIENLVLYMSGNTPSSKQPKTPTKAQTKQEPGQTW
jgi:hypothetical protein